MTAFGKFLTFALCVVVAAISINFFAEGSMAAVNLLPMPWQCSLDYIPASCYGNLQLRAGVGRMLYVLVAIVAPAGIALAIVWSALSGRFRTST